MLFELVIYGTGPWFQKRDSKHGERRNCLGSLLLHLVLLEPLQNLEHVVHVLGVGKLRSVRIQNAKMANIHVP